MEGGKEVLRERKRDRGMEGGWQICFTIITCLSSPLVIEKNTI